MRELDKSKIREILARPNGSEILAERKNEAMDGAWELFMEEKNAAACAFLCAAAKSPQARADMNARLGDRLSLHGMLESEDVKLRKNVARLMGRLGDARDAEPLMAALTREERRIARPSMLLSLGALKGDAVARFLADYRPQPAGSADSAKHYNEEQEALKMARRSCQDVRRHAFTGLKRAHELEIRTPDGMAHVTAAELKDLGLEPYNVRGGFLHVKTKDWDRLFLARSFKEALFPIFRGAGPECADIALKAKGPLTALLEECAQGEPPYGYRVEVRGFSDRGEVSRKLASALDGQSLINSPSRYDAELRIEKRGRMVDVYVKLTCYEDTRFRYRVGSVPASIHPATAAAVLGYASKYREEGARVLDPCCGSGTLLIERELLSPCISLTGVDIDGEALEIARRNAQAAGSEARFIRCDCAKYKTKELYDEIVCNLPFGNRVGSHQDNERLYAAILDNIPAWLRPGGFALMYTMEFTLLKRLVRERPCLSMLAQSRTEAGGLTPGVFILGYNAPLGIQ